MAKQDLQIYAAWVDYVWYKPGDNTPAQKLTYVRSVDHNGTTYIEMTRGRHF